MSVVYTACLFVGLVAVTSCSFSHTSRTSGQSTLLLQCAVAIGVKATDMAVRHLSVIARLKIADTRISLYLLDLRSSQWWMWRVVSYDALWSDEDWHLSAWCGIPQDRSLHSSFYIYLCENEFACIISCNQLILCSVTDFKNRYAISPDRLFIWCQALEIIALLLYSHWHICPMEFF
jgi:hypothetical protein